MTIFHAECSVHSNAKEQILLSEDGGGPQVPHPGWLRTAWGLAGGDH